MDFYELYCKGPKFQKKKIFREYFFKDHQAKKGYVGMGLQSNNLGFFKLQGTVEYCFKDQRIWISNEYFLFVQKTSDQK